MNTININFHESFQKQQNVVPMLYLNKKSLYKKSCKGFVLKAGLEPARPKGHWILSPTCLPIPPLQHLIGIF